MQIPDVMALSLGEWLAIQRGWVKAHRRGPEPPSADEFDAAVMRDRGVSLH